jgi:flavorubredoxin
MAVELYNKGDHRLVMFEDLVRCDDPIEGSQECDAVQANQFLIVDHGSAALIDPGGNLTYNNLRRELFDHVNVRHLDFVIASHQDPDIVASLNKWIGATDCKMVVPQLWARFVPHFCTGATKGRIVGIPDRGANIRLGNAVIKALPAHFLHSEGNFHFYDPIAKVLLTGDIGASMVTADEIAKPVQDFDDHVRHMVKFHQRYMNSNRACRLWVNMVRQLDVEVLVPQHGRYFVGKPMIRRFLDWIENLQCGVDLMTEADYRIPA